MPLKISAPSLASTIHRGDRSPVVLRSGRPAQVFGLRLIPAGPLAPHVVVAQHRHEHTADHGLAVKPTPRPCPWNTSRSSATRSGVSLRNRTTGRRALESRPGPASNWRSRESNRAWCSLTTIERQAVSFWVVSCRSDFLAGDCRREQLQPETRSHTRLYFWLQVSGLVEGQPEVIAVVGRL